MVKNHDPVINKVKRLCDELIATFLAVRIDQPLGTAGSPDSSSGRSQLSAPPPGHEPTRGDHLPAQVLRSERPQVSVGEILF